MSVINSRRMRWVWNVRRMGEMRNVCKFWCENPERKRALGRPRRRWDDNIRMNLGEIGWEGVDCTRLAQDRDQWRAVVNKAMNLRVP
jgi:hypothetical protein